MTREEALKLLTKYNQKPFHLRHALTVEAVMRYLAHANDEDEDFWGLVGLLHDVDYGQFPDEHCVKAPELLAEIHAPEAMVRAICSHGYDHRVNIKPEHFMEKVLYAVDELTGLIWAASQLRPSKSVSDMTLKSVKRKYKDKKFAAGCSRAIIERGADMLGWSLDELMAKTLEAMQVSEQTIEDNYHLLVPENT
ncbi:HD domain-containing protein [bacterium]|nr:HD domain-containing protein [bacterium]